MEDLAGRSSQIGAVDLEVLATAERAQGPTPVFEPEREQVYDDASGEKTRGNGTRWRLAVGCSAHGRPGWILMSRWVLGRWSRRGETLLDVWLLLH